MEERHAGVGASTTRAFALGEAPIGRASRGLADSDASIGERLEAILTRTAVLFPELSIVLLIKLTYMIKRRFRVLTDSSCCFVVQGGGSADGGWEALRRATGDRDLARDSQRG